jgi:hypothetical protein
MQELDKKITEGWEFDKKDSKKSKTLIYEYILTKAKDKFIDHGIDKFESDSLIEITSNPKLLGEFYLLPSEWINFKDSTEKWDKNPIIYSDI